MLWHAHCHDICVLDRENHYHGGFYSQKHHVCECTDPKPYQIPHRMQIPQRRHEGHFTVIESPNRKEEWTPPTYSEEDRQ